MIRPATLADADGLKAAIIAAYAPFAAQGLSLPPVAEGIADDIRDHHVWVVVHGGLILGGVVLVLEGGAAYIANLAVHPKGKGQGYGRQLIDVAKAAARAEGRASIALTTHKDMTGTQKFYSRLGWSVTDRTSDKITFAIDLL